MLDVKAYYLTHSTSCMLTDCVSGKIQNGGCPTDFVKRMFEGHMSFLKQEKLLPTLLHGSNF